MSSVPQFIDVEDKVAGPLTWKQLGWMIGMGAVLLLMFLMLDKVVMIVLSIPVVLLFVALAFYKPNGMPLASFFGHGALFLFRPKIALWERPIPRMVTVAPQSQVAKEVAPPVKKELNQDTLKELARMIDGGRGR